MLRHQEPAARRMATAALALMLGATLAGCVVVPARHYGGYQGGYGEVVMNEPPPPQAEVVGVAPAVGYIWIGGFWNWASGRYAWSPGHWAAPRAGYGWRPHSWYRDGRGWRQRPGGWERRGR